ncbi:glutamine--fructose-6-phosphate transaminase (isomerizing) [Spirochaeta cellobiosiphila]|uniref:glutamine--fructose-6-phosphate transaminase (isomerizing) n=1 Tax=Spirochaeta cellobiosiphila TaxID=504483 RepID=UPI000412CF4A|nr:glutamine--fructose-6-phosphate transaminase (isomerizing) [Spirochaeta cellobiosiphila]
MCGIVGYLGPRKASSVLLQGLRQLEYRGYDSSGISILTNKKIKIYKKEGKLANLIQEVPEKLNSPLGIGHTRWATHGGVSDTNAHPHISYKERVAIVHNGIIDNFTSLKEELIEKGISFSSDTDSEVLAHLIDYYLDEDPEVAVQKALDRIDGTYGVIALFKDYPDILIGARNGSPLILGVGDGESILASDASAFIGLSRQAIYLDDGDMIVVKAKEYKTLDRHYKEVFKQPETIDAQSTTISKEGFDHFLLKEIFEQPRSLSRAMGEGGRLQAEFGSAKLGGLNLDTRDFFDIENIHIIGMGTAYYAGMVGSQIIERLARIPTQVLDASELRFSNPIVKKNTLYLAISQSGETADTITAVKEIQNKGGRVLGIINVVGSTLARLTEGGVYTHGGQEVSVASTKAFTAQIMALTLLALLLGRKKDVPISYGKILVKALSDIPAKVQQILDQAHKIKQIAEKYSSASSFLFLARGLNYPIALEGALKLKEISYIHAEGFSSGGLKHGPLALVDEKTPSVFIVSEGETFEKSLSNMQEVKARKGKIIVITDSQDNRIKTLADDYFIVPQSEEVLMPLLNVIPLQLLSYYIANHLGRDVDQPRNLAKSVTTD